MRPEKTKLETYLEDVERLGFKKVLELPFIDRGGKEEKFFVYFHPRDALLLKFDTYWGLQIHDGRLHYNWRRRCSFKEVYERHLLSSGHWVTEDIYVGDHHIPEANLRRTLRAFRANGKFLRPWIESPFLDLVHHGDYLHGQRLGDHLHNVDRHVEYKKLSAERAQMLPPEVRTALGL